MDEKNMAGVAGLPQTSNFNGCDTELGSKEPSGSPATPCDCRTLENGWQPIETIPEDRPIQAWHIIWKCPVTIQRRSWGDRSAWVEKTLTTEWPLEAFSHWMEVPAPPVQP